MQQPDQVVLRTEREGTRYYHLCAKDNTCPRRVRIKGDICSVCKGVRSAQAHNAGEVFEEHGVRYIHDGSCRRQLCMIADCMIKVHDSSGLCHAHLNADNADAIVKTRNGAVQICPGKERRANGQCYSDERGQWRRCCEFGICRARCAAGQPTCTKHANMPAQAQEPAQAQAPAPAKERAVFAENHDNFALNDDLYEDIDIDNSPATAAKMPVVAAKAVGKAPTSAKPIAKQPAATAALVAKAATPTKPAPNVAKAGTNPNFSIWNTPILPTDMSKYIPDMIIPGSPYDENPAHLLYKRNGVEYMAGNIFTDYDGTRRKVVYRPANNKTGLSVVKMCNGEGNTCINEAKDGGKCVSCRAGGSVLSAVKRELRGMKTGEIRLCSDGLRHIKCATQTKPLCRGENNTCQNIRCERTGGLCIAHSNGSFVHRKGAEIGDMHVDEYGVRRRRNTRQHAKLCYANNNTCTQYSVNGGLCKKHSPAYMCKYQENHTKCDSIIVRGTDYCMLHQGDQLNKKNLSKLELSVIGLLRSFDIDYVHQYTQYVCGKRFIFDFYIPGQEIYIETDGKQHFTAVDHWLGADGLCARQAIDGKKNEYVIENGMSILRIHWRDFKLIKALLTSILDYPLCEQPCVYLSPSYVGADGHVTIYGNVPYCVIGGAPCHDCIYEVTPEQI